MNSFSKYLLIILGVGVLVFALWYFLSIVAYILVAAVLALVGRPLVGILDRVRIWKFRMPHGLNAFLVLIILWFIVFGFFRLFIPLIASEANELSQINVDQLMERLEDPIDKIESFYYDITRGDAEAVNFEDYISGKISSVLNISILTNIFSSVFSMLGNIFVAVFAISFITFFILKDKHIITNSIVLLIPEKHEEAIRNAFSSIRRLLMRYFIGIGGQITAIMILITIGMIIAGIELRLAMTIALIIGLLNVIPYLGPFLGGSIGILLGIANNLHLDFESELLPLIGYMFLVVLIVQIVDNVLFQPLIFSSSVKSHPLEIFLVIMVAGTTAGIPGMILGIPSYVVIRVFAKEFFNHLRVVKKLTQNI